MSSVLYGTHVTIEASVFVDNARGLAMNSFFSNDIVTARNSLFLRNSIYAVGGYGGQRQGSSFEGCVFGYNRIAIERSIELPRVDTSVFVENEVAIEMAATEIIESAFVRNRLAVSGAKNISVTTFEQNEIGIRGSVEWIGNSNFLDNSIFHIEESSSTSWSATNLFWGTGDVKEVRSKIKDIFIDTSLGLVTIEPLAISRFEHSWDWKPHVASFLEIEIVNRTMPATPQTNKPSLVVPTTAWLSIGSPPMVTPGASSASTSHPSQVITTTTTKPSDITSCPTSLLDGNASSGLPEKEENENPSTLDVIDQYACIANLTEVNEVLVLANGRLEEANRRLQEANDILRDASTGLSQSSGSTPHVFVSLLMALFSALCLLGTSSRRKRCPP